MTTSLDPVTRDSAGRRAPALLAVAGVLWGTGGIAGSYLTSAGGVHPLGVACARLLLGGLCTVLWLGATRKLRAVPRGRAVLVRITAVAVLLAVFQVSYFAAVALTSVSVATMTTIGSVPVLVALLTTVRDRRLPGAATLSAIGLALAGLMLLNSSGGSGATGARLAAGLALAVLAGAGFAVLTLVNGRQVTGLDPLASMGLGFLAGGVLLLPVAALAGNALVWRADVLAVALFLAVIPTAVAYGSYFRALRTARPVLAGLAALLEPLVAALLAALLLGERLGLTGWCGAALLVTALTLAAVRR